MGGALRARPEKAIRREQVDFSEIDLLRADRLSRQQRRMPGIGATGPAAPVVLSIAEEWRFFRIESAIRVVNPE
ncbi:hypothetical protein [Microbacterium sp. H1-D42]|uniref:hypothetical protein n=1 Tax=Microbacterium sp. H1-D42 TaxID=2925844 RepID=UPI001F530829|nr:hypothetical protein [Microbacterium sp. H1-D42]UNK71173.1 hypothetical protein MNR00_01615 [Microbacterium sp. H1-D42]